MFPSYRGFNAELHKRRNVEQDTFKDEEYHRVRETQVGDAQIVNEVAKFSPLNYNGAILPPGHGSLAAMVSCQSTPVPVNTVATTSTVTVSTSPVSLTTQKWEHYKFWVPASQVGQLDPINFGSTVTQPTMSGQPFTLSQHTRPSLPAHLEKLIPTAQTDTEADDPKMIEDVSDIIVA